MGQVLSDTGFGRANFHTVLKAASRFFKREEMVVKVGNNFFAQSVHVRLALPEAVQLSLFYRKISSTQRDSNPVTRHALYRCATTTALKLHNRSKPMPTARPPSSLNSCLLFQSVERDICFRGERLGTTNGT